MDEALRKLERAFRASGSPADEAAYLHARLRRGELLSEGYRTTEDLLRRVADDDRVVEEAMQWIYTLGLCLERYPWLPEEPAFLAFQRRSAELLVPMVVTRLVETTCEEIDQALSSWSSEVDCYRFPEVPWRRSAIAFLTHLYRQFDVRSSLDRPELQELDDFIFQRREVMGTFDEEVPVGMPGRHWWWWRGPRGSVEGVKTGPYVACHRSRSGWTSPPHHPIRLRLPEEVQGA